MKKLFSKLIATALSVCIASTVLLGGAVVSQAADTWRSALYPENWTPGYSDSSGRFLHDFSYAGYMMGEQEPPTEMSGLFANVLNYGADNTGANDSTSAIQSAINAVQNAGGGTVYLPSGTYKVKPASTSNSAALRISGSNILFKGDGVGKTFIRCFAESMRYCQVINVSPNGGTWDSADDGNYYYLSQDIGNQPTTTIHLNSVGNLKVGDWVIIRSDRTSSWINDHGMSGFWSASVNSTTLGTTFYRQITAVNSTNKTIEIDIPTRYYMKTRDNARVYKVSPKQRNVGLMDFSIGNKAHSGTSGWGEEDYNTSGNGAYDVNNAFLIKFGLNVNCFAKNISTYQAGNSSTVHMSSNGLDINKTRNLTIDNCDFSHPQYEGGGGNGYGMNICGQETLIKNCSSTSARHSFSFKYAYANGNVIYHYTSTGPKYGSDFHMYLSMSNLIDCEELNGDFLESNVRPYGGTAGNRHGYTSTQTVFWNTKGNYYKSGSSYIIDSRQYGYGYIIGTQGAATAVKTTPTTMSSTYGTVNTAPEDYKEGIGTSATLEPQSLYYDQLSRRLGGSAPSEPTFEGELISEGKTATATSQESNDYPASNLVDGDLSTRWSSAFADGESATIDLGAACTVTGVKLYWEDAYASSYKIRTSTDGTTWNDAYIDTAANGGTDSIELAGISARYVQVYCTTRSTQYGSSLYEVKVYGMEPITIPGTFNAIQTSGRSDEISINKTPGGISYVGNMSGTAYLEYNVNVANAGQYRVTLNAIAGNSNSNRTMYLYDGNRLLASVPVVNGTDWEAFVPHQTVVSFDTAGEHNLRILSSGSVNIADITFEAPVTIPASITHRENNSYYINVPTAGLYKLTASLAAADGTGQVTIAADGTELGIIAIQSTGSPETFRGHSQGIYFNTPGLKTLTLTPSGSAVLGDFSIAYGAQSLEVPGTVSALDYTYQTGVAIGASGTNLRDVTAGDTMIYNVDVKTSGTYTIAISAGTTGTNAAAEISSDFGGQYASLGTVNIANTGAFGTYTDNTAQIHLDAGVQNLKITVANASFNFASFTLTCDKEDQTTVTPPDAFVFKVGSLNAYWATYDYAFTTGVACQFVDGVTYVPFRDIANAAGAKSIDFDAAAGTVTIVNGYDMTFNLTMNSTACTVTYGGNTQSSTLNSAPQFIDGVCCLPIRDVSNITFASVQFVETADEGYVLVSANVLSNAEIEQVIKLSAL